MSTNPSRFFITSLTSFKVKILLLLDNRFVCEYCRPDFALQDSSCIQFDPGSTMSPVGGAGGMGGPSNTNGSPLLDSIGEEERSLNKRWRQIQTEAMGRLFRIFLRSCMYIPSRLAFILIRLVCSCTRRNDF